MSSSPTDTPPLEAAVAEWAAAALTGSSLSLSALDAAVDEHLSKIDELSAALDAVR